MARKRTRRAMVVAPEEPVNTRRTRHTELLAECAALNAEIQSLEAQVQAKQKVIDEKRHTVNMKMKECAPLAPVYTLPDEVWREILVTAFRHNFPYCRKSHFTLTHSPIAFSHVSRQFRKLALALPTIWDCIHITPRQPTHYVHMLRQQLSRCRSVRPISVTFVCRSPCGGTVPELDPVRNFPSKDFQSHFGACWEELVKHVGRWRHLSFWAEHSLIVDTLLNNPAIATDMRLTMPQLEYLDICMAHEDSHTAYLKTVIDAPRLSVLRLQGVLPVADAPLNMFHHITKLTLTGMKISSQSFEAILGPTSKTLTALLLDEIRFTDEEFTYLVLSKLRHLVLKHTDCIDLPFYLFSAWAPNLARLEVEAPLHVDDSELTPDERSSLVLPAVTKLHLFSHGEHTFSSLLTPSFFELFPAVEQIVVHEEDSLPYTQTFLKSLIQYLTSAGRARKRNLMPPLTKLWMSHPRDLEDLMKLILLKEELGCPFEEVVLLTEETVDEEDENDDKADNQDSEAEEEILSIIRCETDRWPLSTANQFQEWDNRRGAGCPSLQFWLPDDYEVPPSVSP